MMKRPITRRYQNKIFYAIKLNIGNDTIKLQNMIIENVKAL